MVNAASLDLASAETYHSGTTPPPPFTLQIASALVSGFGYICYPAPMAVRGDGVVYITEPTNAGLQSVTVADPNGSVSGFEFPPSEVTTNGNTIPVQCCVGPPTVNTDGTVYLEYEVRTTNNNVITSDTLYLYSSTTNAIVLSSTTQNEALLPGPIIPDGQGGVLATWTISAQPVLQFPYQAADVTSGVVGTPYNLPFSPQSVAPFQSPTLVLGQSGVAFASGSTTATIGGIPTSVDQIASFNLSSGVTNWTYQGATGTHLSIIEATSGNGLAAKSTDQNSIDTVLLFNSSGGQSQVMRRFTGHPALAGFSNLDYYGNSWWVGTSNGGPLAVLGSAIQSAMSSYAHLMGNSKQSSGLPIVDTFEPFDPDPIKELAVDFSARYTATKNLKSVSLSQLTTSVSRILQEATWKKFQNRPATVTALGFIGHSMIPITAPKYPNRAVGLCFSDVLAERAAVPGDPEYCTTLGCFEGYIADPPCPQATEYPASLLANQATIIFISACNMDANMQAWLGITNTTTGRAVVVPESNSEVVLGMGEYEWLHILRYLTSGQNLQQAVFNANADVASPQNHWTDNQGNPVPAQAWQVIGDSGNGGTGIKF